MVIVGNLNFPFSKTNLNVLIGTVNVPYQSQSTAGYKTAFMNCPISMYLNFTKYTPQTMGITVVSQSGANIQVYKNGVLLTTTPNNSYTGVNISKGFVLSSSASNVVCNFNSYYYNVYCQYTPPANTNYGTTDVYTFYAQINYTVSSTVTPLTYIGNYAISYIIDVNTTTSTSSFTNFSYASGSTDTAGYGAYSLTNQPNYAFAWDGSQAPSYQPTTTNSLWTGLYQLAVLYANYIFTAQGIVMKNTGFTNTLSWYDSDANGSGYQTLVYASNLSNGFKIDMNASKMTNGMIVSGGTFSSTSQQPTWYLSTTTGGNAYTPAGRNLGSSFNSTSSRWDSVTVYGGANSANWDKTNGIFTADKAGTYFFQLSCFNNSTGTSGRWLQAGGTCVLGGSQYLFFDESYLTSEGAFTVSVMYYMSVGQTFYFACPNQSPLFFYANGHTTCQIIKML